MFLIHDSDSVFIYRHAFWYVRPCNLVDIVVREVLSEYITFQKAVS